MTRPRTEKTSDPILAEAYHHQADVEEKRKHGYVYFIGDNLSSPIKIGMSRSPQSRLRVLNDTTWRSLRILALRQGLFVREMAYHAQFGEHRLEGEWFARHPDILAEISRINKEAAQ